MGRLMRTIDLNPLMIIVALIQVFIVALNSYLLDQIPHEDGDVFRGDAGIYHRGLAAAPFAVLTEALHFDGARPAHQPHVEDHHHSVGGPAPWTVGALEPSWGRWHMFINDCKCNALYV